MLNVIIEIVHYEKLNNQTVTWSKLKLITLVSVSLIF